MKNIKYIIYISLSFVFFLNVSTVHARPITEYNEGNKQELNRQFQDYLSMFPELQIDENISIDSKYYPTYIYLKEKDKLQDWYIQRLFRNITPLEFAQLIFNILDIPEKKNINIKIAEDIEKHPDKDVLVKALQKGILENSPRKKLEPNKPMFVKDINRALNKLRIPTIKKDGEYIEVQDFLHHLVSYKKTQDNPYKDLSTNTPSITIDKRELLIDGKLFQSICVNWLIQDNKSLSEFIFRHEIQKMKDMGIRCISTEIGWSHLMEKENSFKIPPHIQTFFKVTQKEGMMINLLLSPHYTPNWVFNKYQENIRMVDKNGVPQKEGEYITYSLHSPAVQDQIEFQKKAIQEFSKYNNILSFLLTNEVSYGRTHDLDYSTWAENGWKKFLEERGLKERPIPKDETSEDYKIWKRFRQISLVDYYNKTYKETKNVLPRFIPITHKHIPYESTSYYAMDYGIHPSPKELEGEILATDIYGVSPNVYAFYHALTKPVLVIETNLPGDWDETSMYHYLLMNYLHGIHIQTIFQWNPGTHANVMFYPDGKPWTKTKGIERAAKLISSFQKDHFNHPKSVIILPTHSINVNGRVFEKNQYVFDDNALYLFEKTGKYPMLIWIDDLKEGYYEKSPNLYTAEELKNIEYIAFAENAYDNLSGIPFLKNFSKVPDHPDIWKRY